MRRMQGMQRFWRMRRLARQRMGGTAGPAASPGTSARGARGLALLAALALLGAGPCGEPAPGPRITAPADGLLSTPGSPALEVVLPSGADATTLALELDGQPVAANAYAVVGNTASGVLPPLAAGAHQLLASVAVGGATRQAVSDFQLVSLDRPDDCEPLNQADCLLPYPSSRFLAPAATPTGVSLEFGASTLPNLGLGPLDPTPYRKNDGFSPTTQVLMNFPAGVDLVQSNAPRLDPQRRVYGVEGLEAGSPSVLVDLETGERVNHWLENDDRAKSPQRVVTFLRPGESLIPGHHYAVAIRGLRDAAGAAIAAEPVFAAIRDGAPSDIPAVEAERARLEPVLSRLAELGVARGDLQLAFDFTVQSDFSLTHEMLSMRDQALAWFEAQRAAGVQTFVVDDVQDLNPGCADPNQPAWRFVQGRFQVPLFLGSDPFLQAPLPAMLQRGSDGEPVWSQLTEAPFGIAIPCSAFSGPEGTLRPLAPLLVGHGLFGNGPSTVKSLATNPAFAGFDFVSGGTNWSGLSTPDTQPTLLQSFVVNVLLNLNQIDALADRLRQGQTNTLVLARMLREGAFNADPAFQDANGKGVILPDRDLFYVGGSLGGIMGTMFAALTDDAERLNVDVPAINFSLLLQRATPFVTFDALLNQLSGDPVVQAVGLSLIHEIWVRGEPAGYATHVTSNPLPGSFPKRILMTAALYDQQVSNLGSLLSARTLRLPTLPGSTLRGLPGLPDATGPQASGFIIYDTASFDLTNPAHLPFVPPLVNRPATSNRCDPHGRRSRIPAAIDQVREFLTPLGKIHNFCTDDGVCNASEPYEIPDGASAACDPLG